MEHSIEGEIESRLVLWRKRWYRENGPECHITVAQEFEARERIRLEMALEGKAERDFFQRNIEDKQEIIDGLLRESQLATFSGPFGMGKSPVLADLAVHLVSGIPWCGRGVAKRPVIHIDCETPGPDYKKAICAIAARLAIPVPSVPNELEPYLERDDVKEATTQALLRVVSSSDHKPKLQLLEAALSRKPSAVVFIDPLEMFFSLDTTKKRDVLRLFSELRLLMARFPNAALLGTFNLRKQDKKNGRPDLLLDPRGWLEEVCGSLDLLNRSDVRLGIDIHNDDVRVINGIVRGREMDPVLVRPVTGANDELGGFERVCADQQALAFALTLKQWSYWILLPLIFRFEEVADKEIAGTRIPRSTLSRITQRATLLGILTKDNDGTFRKTSGDTHET